MVTNMHQFINIDQATNFYFDNRNCILIIGIILSVIVCSYILIKLKSLNSIDILGNCTLNVVIIFIVGYVVHTTGLNLNFAVSYVPLLIFVSAVFITICITVVECIKYRKTYQEVIKSASRIIGYIIECELLLLAIMGRLDFIELLSSWIGLITLKLSEECIEKITEKNYEKINNSENKKGDRPIIQEEELFEGRRKQLDSLKRELEQFSGEPFAVIVSGEWGSGKTSLVNILRKNMESSEFVDVECGVEYDVKGILNDIATQIQAIFDKNKIYTGNNSKIGQYFAKIAELVDNIGYSAVSKFINKISNGGNASFIESKKRLNRELDAFYALTGKKIYIIVDDMDRIVDNKMRAIIFLVIRESVSLNNCCTLFMVDYDKLISEYISREFLEKYVNHHIEISKVKFDEIIESYLEIYFPSKYWEGKSIYIKEKGAEVKSNIIRMARKILSSLERRKNQINESMQKENQGNSNIEELTRQFEILSNTELKLKTRMSNPRKVKRFLDSIEKRINIADILWFQNENYEENEYSQENWVDIICQIAFLQAFLVEEYNVVLSAKSLVNLRKDKDHSRIIEIFLDGFTCSPIGFNRKEEITEKIIYQLYALDVETDKTFHQLRLEEIKRGELLEEYLDYYISECLGRDLDFPKMKIILDYFENNKNSNSRRLSEGAVRLVELILHNQNFGKEGYIEVLAGIKKIVDVYKLQGLFNKQQKTSLEFYIGVLQTGVIFQNFSNLRYIFNAVYDKKIVDDNLYIDNIDKLYQFIVKVNQENPLDEFVLTEQKLSSIQNYVSTLQDIINKKDYRFARESLIYFMDKILNTLSVLEIWFGEENDYKGETVVTKFVDFDAETLENSQELIETLSMFKKSIIEYPDNRKNGETFIQLSIDIENLLDQNLDCYGEEGKEVILILCSIYELFKVDDDNMKLYFGDKWWYVPVRLLHLRHTVGILED